MNPLPAALAVACLLSGGALALWSVMPPPGVRVGQHWRGQPLRHGRVRWHLTPDLPVIEWHDLGYLAYHEACLLLWWDPDQALKRIASGDARLEVPHLPDDQVERLCQLVLTHPERFDVSEMSMGLQHKFTEHVAMQLVNLVERNLTHAGRQLGTWETQFQHPSLPCSLYPKPDRSAKPPLAGLIAVLTRMDADTWNEVMQWPMWRLFVWMETKRVQSVLDERDAKRRKATRKNG